MIESWVFLLANSLLFLSAFCFVVFWSGPKSIEWFLRWRSDLRENTFARFLEFFLLSTFLMAGVFWYFLTLNAWIWDLAQSVYLLVFVALSGVTTGFVTPQSYRAYVRWSETEARSDFSLLIFYGSIGVFLVLALLLMFIGTLSNFSVR